MIFRANSSPKPPPNLTGSMHSIINAVLFTTALAMRRRHSPDKPHPRNWALSASRTRLPSFWHAINSAKDNGEAKSCFARDISAFAVAFVIGPLKMRSASTAKRATRALRVSSAETEAFLLGNSGTPTTSPYVAMPRFAMSVARSLISSFAAGSSGNSRSRKAISRFALASNAGEKSACCLRGSGSVIRSSRCTGCSRAAYAVIVATSRLVWFRMQASTLSAT